MFSLASGMYENYFATQQLNVLLIGCEGVGKTTLLERLKVTQFSPRPKIPKPQRKVTRNISCPGPSRYDRAKENQDDDEEILVDSSSERFELSERWVKSDNNEDEIAYGAQDVKESHQNQQIESTNKAKQGNNGEVPPKLQPIEDDNNNNNEYDVKPGLTMLPMIKIRPTMGQNLAKINISGAKCHIFDISGKFQDLWERYYPDAEAVIFCWKLSESEDQQRQVLEQVRKKIPDDVPFLIFGHIMEEVLRVEKQSTSLPTSTEYFLPNYHSNVVQLYCGSAKSGKGVREAMEWLVPLAKRHASLRALTLSSV